MQDKELPVELLALKDSNLCVIYKWLTNIEIELKKETDLPLRVFIRAQERKLLFVLECEIYGKNMAWGDCIFDIKDKDWTAPEEILLEGAKIALNGTIKTMEKEMIEA